MNDTFWILQEQLWHKVIEKEIINYFNSNNINYIIVNKNDHDIRSLVPVNHLNDKIMFYGSLEMARRVRLGNFNVGLFCTIDNYKCSNYYSKYNRCLLNSNYVMFPFGDLINKKDFINNIFKDNNGFFIRPDSGEKIFTGYTTTIDVFDIDLDECKKNNNVKDSDIVLVSPYQKIFREWRFFVSYKEILSSCIYKSSFYKVREEDQASKAAYELVEFLREVYSPDEFFVMDIAETKDNFFLLEINAFSTSGIYDCSTEVIIKSVNNYLKDN